MRLAQVRHDREWWVNSATGELVVNWRGEDPEFSKNFSGDYAYPGPVPHLMSPQGVKNSLQITQPWWDYTDVVNEIMGTMEGRRAALRNNAGYINWASNQTWGQGEYLPKNPSPLPTVEGITSIVKNYVNVLGTKSIAARIETFLIANAPPDPAKVNPRTHPWLFCHFTSIDKYGNIGWAPDGKEFWFPLLAKGEAYIPLAKLKLDVELPQETNMDKGRNYLPKGKGWYIWQIRMSQEAFGVVGASNGSTIVQPVIDGLKAQGVSWVAIKIADGQNRYNLRRPDWTDDLIGPLVDGLAATGIESWGWQYTYATNPSAEANFFANRFRQFNLVGTIVDAEEEYKGKYSQATTYMNTLRAALPNVSIGISSYRFPSFHQTFPWGRFGQQADFWQPQVYWVSRHNPREQLIQSTNEHLAIKSMPIIPAGMAYRQFGYEAPTPGELDEFHNAVRELNLSAETWWECAAAKPLGLWPTIAAHEWGSQPDPEPIPVTLEERVIDLERRVAVLEQS